MALDHRLIGTIPEISRADALILLVLLGVFIYTSFGDVAVRSQDPLINEINEIRLVMPSQREHRINLNWVYISAGTVLLAIGGHLTVDKGAEFATAIGLPPVVVGMIVLAIGTSLPELVTSVIAAMKNESDLCLGNIVGSNLFNSLFVLPVSALIRPLTIPAGGVLDILLTLAFSAVLLLVFLFEDARMNRRTAFAMLSVYLAYMVMRTLG
jgi:cation:H+ antiporter